MITDHTPLAHSEVPAALLAGKAILTVCNVKTGNRFTFKISRCEDNPTLYFVGVLTGPDNETNYQYLGCIRGAMYSHGRKSKISATAQSAQVFAWLWAHQTALPACIEIWHEGHCLRCGRTLTVPESLSSGYGPECVKKVNQVA